MAEETMKTAPEATGEVVAVSDVPEAEKPVTTTTKIEPTPAPEPEPEVPEKAAPVEEATDKPKPAAEEEKINESASFKEETNVANELPDPQKKALDDLKLLVQAALNNHDFTSPPPPPPAKEVVEEKPPATAAEEESKPEVITPEAEAPPPAAEPSEPVVIAEVIEKIEVIDDDGAKTVEAIEETIVVAVTDPAPAEPKEEAVDPAVPPPPPEEVCIWGIPLLADERSDVILLKFLRARDFKVKEAFSMLKSVIAWRKEFGIESLVVEDEEVGGCELEKVAFIHGFDKEGHPVCYNAYGEFQNKELYHNTFADEKKRTKFLRWRIQFLEKSIRTLLDFSPEDGISTFVQINDLKNSPGPLKRELRQATNQALQLLQDNYPEFVAKQVFINVPWWYLAFYGMINPFLTQRTKSKFVFAGPSKSAETLFKYIAPELVPVQYGGLSREGEKEFTTADPATEEIIKPATKHTIEFPVPETCLLVWEVRVVGWDVSYGAEFVPSAEDGYTVIVHKSRKIRAADEAVISNSYKIEEPGKVVLTFDNQTAKKKKLLCRSKTKPFDCV